MGRRVVLALLGWSFISTSDVVLAGEPLSFEHSSHLSPSDYLLGSKRESSDAAFDGAKPIDLGVDLGVGADCGRVDFRSTLRSTLQNMLDSRYFGDLGKDVIAASPMLVACYFSPTWCSILKHSQLSANFLSEMRLSQCQIIDKYVDSRTEDFYRERQTCAHDYIKQNGGDLEQAMSACSQNVFDGNLANWAGGSGDKVGTNELIEASAKWAGFDTTEARPSVDLLKSMIGDTIVSKGKVSVSYGPASHATPPAARLLAVQERVRQSLCDGLLPKASAALQNGKPVDGVTTDAALKEVGGGKAAVIDRQTVESLALMSRREREAACRKLADAIGVTEFSKETSRALDILTAAAQNPNLPPNRRQEIEEKRRELKDSVDEALTLARERDSVLSNVQAEINEAGERHRSARAFDAVSLDRNADARESVRTQMFDCNDPLFCRGE